MHCSYQSLLINLITNIHYILYRCKFFTPPYRLSWKIIFFFFAVRTGSLKKIRTNETEMPDKLTVHMQKMGHPVGGTSDEIMQPPEPTAQPKQNQPVRY